MDQLPAYTLGFTIGLDSLTSTSGSLGAVLRSPLLDLALHPDGLVRVMFASRHPAGEAVGFALDAFQIHSMHEYLLLQAKVRQTLEAELGGCSPGSLSAKKAKRGRRSGRAIVSEIGLYCRDVPSRELLATMRRLHGPKVVKDTIAGADKEDTRTRFLVYVRAGEQDHLAVFRDGALASFENL